MLLTHITERVRKTSRITTPFQLGHICSNNEVKLNYYQKTTMFIDLIEKKTTTDVCMATYDTEIPQN